MLNFKEKLNYAIVKNRSRAWLIIAAITIGFMTPVMILTEFSLTEFVVFDIFMLAFSYSLVLPTYARIINPSVIKLYNECDPYPLLECCEKLSKYVNRGNEGMQVTVNYAAALVFTGEAEKAYTVLKGFNVEANQGTVPTTRLMYYSNLVTACEYLKKGEEAEVWYEKAMQAYNCIKNRKQKQLFISTYLNLEGDHLMRQGEYALALNKYQGVFAENRYGEVVKSYNCAKAYAAMGDFTRARQHLNIVIGLGNKLAIVKEAEKLLERLDAPKTVEEGTDNA